MIASNYPLLSKINHPADLQKLPCQKLPDVCTELRHFIIDIVAKYGGHLGASLGVVELTVALHYTFELSDDKIVWDVGHQAYGHKILTGRRDQFYQNRKYKGLSGFPSRSESVFDHFGTGHSSTSISAILGMAMASHLQKKKCQHIAVIGDGGLTAGIAFEALNNLGISPGKDTNTLVIVNDNGMSIDRNTGALHETFHEKNTAGKCNFFKSLNIPYYGIYDGHNLTELLNLLTMLKQEQGAKILHLRTIKGRGFEKAEKNQIAWHATGTFNKISGKRGEKIQKPYPPKYQEVFGETITELAQTNQLIVGITPAMLSGSSLQIMKDKFPNRVFDVGIAEQHAVTFAAGLSTQGILPFCNLYSTFSQRAYDQIIHDVCLQNLKVIFCLDRAGLVGEDGATHHGVFDMAFLRCIPNITLFEPLNESELRNILYTAQLPSEKSKMKGAIVIRYPRGRGTLVHWRTPFEVVEMGKGRLLSKGQHIAILSVGHLGNQVQMSLEGLRQKGIAPAHFDMRFIKPLDTDLLDQVFHHFSKIITIENGVYTGGFGSAVSEYATNNGFSQQIIRLGIPDRFITQGKISTLQQTCLLDVETIQKTVISNW